MEVPHTHRPAGSSTWVAVPRAWASRSTSSWVFSGPKDTRSIPSRTGLDRPMAAYTWLAYPRWQADPADRQNPWSLSQRTTTWLGYPGREMAQMWGASPAATTTSPGTAFWKAARA